MKLFSNWSFPFFILLFLSGFISTSLYIHFSLGWLWFQSDRCHQRITGIIFLFGHLIFHNVGRVPACLTFSDTRKAIIQNQMGFFLYIHKLNLESNPNNPIVCPDKTPLSTECDWGCCSIMSALCNNFVDGKLHSCYTYSLCRTHSKSS